MHEIYETLNLKYKIYIGRGTRSEQHNYTHKAAKVGVAEENGGE